MPGKNPVFVESGREGARRRWGPQRVVRLDNLTAAERDVVLALVSAAKETAPVTEMPGAESEVGHDRPAPTS